MLPTAGLFLPETLHRNDDYPTVPTSRAATNSGYSQRRSERPKQQSRNSDDPPSATLPRATSEDGIRVLPSLATHTLTFADIVPLSNKAVAGTISAISQLQSVRQDITEASRLYLTPSVSHFLDAWPDKRTWVDDTLVDVRRALNDIGIDMDTIAMDSANDDTTTSKRKFEWSISHHRRIMKRRHQLQACHHNLRGAIHVMQTVEMCESPGGTLQDPIFEAPVRPWLSINTRDALRGPYSRQKHRLSQTNLSSSSVKLSQPAEQNFSGKLSNVEDKSQ